MLAHAMEFEEAITTLKKHKVDTSKKNYIGHTADDITAIRQNMKSLHIQDHQRMMAQNTRSSVTKENHAENVKTELINQQLRSMLQVKPEGNTTRSPTPFYPQMPYVVISPVPNPSMNYLGVPNGLYPIQRKSSNMSPFLFSSPNVSPITPMNQQVFFPPDFPISQYHQMTQHLNNSMTPHQSSLNLNACLNMSSMSSSGMILSPAVFMSPCM